jgi:hypothetical protein
MTSSLLRLRANFRLNVTSMDAALYDVFGMYRLRGYVSPQVETYPCGAHKSFTLLIK